MQFTLKSALFHVGCLLLVSCLTGCQSKPTPSRPPVRLTIWTMQLGQFGNVLTPMFQRFEQQHPGVKVQWVDVPFSEMEKRALVGLLGNDPPDVINLNPTFSALLAARGALVDMRQALPKTTQLQYLPVAWESVSLPNQGMTYGLPWYLTTSLTFWNLKLIEHLPPGVSFPQGEPGWPELLARGPQMKAQAAWVSFPAITEHGALLKWFAKQGVSPCDPQAATDLKWLVGAVEQGYLPRELITEGHRTALERFQSGRLLMLSAGSSFLKMIGENAPQLLPELKITPQFGSDHHTVDIATMLLAVPKRTPHQALAVELAIFMTNAANQLAFAKQAPVLPSSRQALDNPFFSAKPQADGNDSHMTLLAAEARRLSVHQLLKAKRAFQVRPDQPDVDEVTDALAQAALLKKLTPSQATAQICARLRQS